MPSQRSLPRPSACCRSGGNVFQLPLNFPSSFCCSPERLDQGTACPPWPACGAEPWVPCGGGCCAKAGGAAASSTANTSEYPLIIFLVSGRRRLRFGRGLLPRCVLRISRLDDFADIGLRQVIDPTSIVRSCL